MIVAVTYESNDVTLEDGHRPLYLCLYEQEGQPYNRDETYESSLQVIADDFAAHRRSRRENHVARTITVFNQIPSNRGYGAMFLNPIIDGTVHTVINYRGGPNPRTGYGVTVE